MNMLTRIFFQSFKIKKYKIISMNFTEQFIYNYLLMARKNIDQPVGTDKNTQIKFNERKIIRKSKRIDGE